MRRGLHGGDAVSGVLQVAPGAARAMIQIGRDLRQRVAELIRSTDTASGAEHVSQVRRQTLINPQQIGLHGFFVVWRGQVRWPAVFSVPGMHIFVRKEP